MWHCYFILQLVRARDGTTACPSGSYHARIDSQEEFRFLYSYLTQGASRYWCYGIITVLNSNLDFNRSQISARASHRWREPTRVTRELGLSRTTKRNSRSSRGVLAFRRTALGIRTACLSRLTTVTASWMQTAIFSRKLRCVKLKCTHRYPTIFFQILISIYH